MLPRRCKKCRCYVAPQLQRCPRCNKTAPALPEKQTKEERQEERDKRDAKVPIIHAKNIHWVPSAFALQTNKEHLKELDWRMAKADTPRLRNTIRSEIRATQAVLSRAKIPPNKKPWTSEIFHGKTMCVSVYISPTKRRYVLAARDGPADLIVVNPKKRRYRGIEIIRLRRFENSPYARMKRAEKVEETAHKQRRKAKKERRAKKRRILAAE